MKDHVVGVRLDAIEKARLEKLAADMGIERCDVVRHLIKAASDKPPVNR